MHNKHITLEFQSRRQDSPLKRRLVLCLWPKKKRWQRHGEDEKMHTTDWCTLDRVDMASEHENKSKLNQNGKHTISMGYSCTSRGNEFTLRVESPNIARPLG
jgi:hypothetical protein